MSDIKFPDRFLDWQSSKPGAVRRPFSDRNIRPLGPEIVLETVLVRRLQTLSEQLTSSPRSECWVKPKGIFLVGVLEMEKVMHLKVSSIIWLNKLKIHKEFYPILVRNLAKIKDE